MAFLRALVDATPLSLIVALAAFFLARSSAGPPLPPLVLGPLVGVAALAGGTGVSLSFQTEDRRYPLTWVALELLALP